MSTLASVGMSKEKREAPRLEVSVLEAMVRTLCSGTMVRTLLTTQRKGFMLGKEAGGERQNDSNECVWKGWEQTGKWAGSLPSR